MDRLEAAARAVLEMDERASWVEVESGEDEVRAVCKRCGGWIWINRRCRGVDVKGHLAAFATRHRTCRG